MVCTALSPPFSTVKRYRPGGRLTCAGVGVGHFWSSTVIDAPSGSLCTMTIPLARAIVKTGRSTGESVTLIERVVVLNPARLSASVCSPMLALSMHGVTQAVPGNPSRTTVAPEGWLRTGTSTDVGSFEATVG